MMRFWIIAAMAVVTIALTGCGQRVADPPSGPSDRTLVEGTPSAAEGSPPNAVVAPENERAVPAVVGMPVEEACLILWRGNYSGGIFAIKSARGAGAGSVVAQDPKPGAEYFLGGMVHLIVSEPFVVEDLPRNSNCVDRTDMGMEQFGVD